MKKQSKKNEKIKLDINDLLTIDKETSWDFTILRDFTKEYPKKTLVCCWWCCHKFDNQPLGVPMKYEKEINTFNVVGCFCSIECVAAYVYDNRVMYKNVFPMDIKLMYKKISGDKEYTLKDGILKRAHPRQVLKIFGGKLSIDEFRSSNKCKMITLLHAPLTSMYLTCETINVNGKCEKVDFSKSTDLEIRKKSNIIEKEPKVVKKSTQKRSISQLVSFV
jgi:hypothetical protein